MDKELSILINKALDILYERDLYLIMNKPGESESVNGCHHVGERTIMFRLAHYMVNIMSETPVFDGYSLDCEYNRNKGDRKTLPTFPKGVYPDIIIHKRDSNENNFAVIEIKTYWNSNQSRDSIKIKELTNPEGEYRFKNGVMLKLAPKRDEVSVIDISAERMEKLETSSYLRKAIPEDIDILYSWANDPETRQNSFNQHVISREEHEAWFAGMMSDPNRIQYVLMSGDTPVGQIRIDITGDTAEISYSIAPRERGKGYGHRIIELAKKEVEKEYPFMKTLKASVKPQNQASISCFVDNGFIENQRVYVAKTVNITGGGGR